MPTEKTGRMGVREKSEGVQGERAAPGWAAQNGHEIDQGHDV